MWLMLLLFELLIDHCPDEIVKAEVAFGFVSFRVKRCLRVGFAIELGKETDLEVIVLLEELVVLVNLLFSGELREVGSGGVQNGCGEIACLTETIDFV